MKSLLPITIIISGPIRSICWLIDRKDQRRFCRTATPEQVEAYLKIIDLTESHQLSPVKKLGSDTEKNEKCTFKVA